MKKAATIGAALLGLLFVGCATNTPQDPTPAGDPVLRQAAPPAFRDVLRGKIGQECQAGALQGIWVIQFSPAVGEADEERELDPAPLLVPSSSDLRQMLRENGVVVSSRIVNSMRNEALERVTREFIGGYIDGDLALVEKPADVLTLAAVGQDFVQLREADGTERFVPLSRVDVVVEPVK